MIPIPCLPILLSMFAYGQVAMPHAETTQDEALSAQHAEVVCGDALVVKNGYVYACFEWPFVTETGEGIEAPEHNILTAASSPQRFINIRHDVEQTWDRVMTIACCEGVPLISPSQDGREVMKVESALDTPISLSIREASTWDAIKQVVQAVNRAPRFGRVLDLLFMRYSSFVPPHPFAGEKVIELEVRDTPAREALCAILAQSPVPLVFNYYNSTVKVKGTSLWYCPLYLVQYDGTRRLGLSLEFTETEVKHATEELDAANAISPEVLAEHAVVDLNRSHP